MLSTLDVRQELSKKADEELFGSKAVMGHQFLVAKPRDINAPATAKPITSGIEGLLDAYPKAYLSSSSSSSSCSSPNSGSYRDTSAAAAARTTSTNRARSENTNYDHSGDPKEERRTGSKFRERAEELGESGEILKRLKPLLDSFIREDAQRTGTLPASDFRRVICEGHGGLWPDLAVGSERRRAVPPEYTGGELRW